MRTTCYIKGGRLLDPATGRDETGDLFLSDQGILPLPSSVPSDCEIIDAEGLIVTPGLIDLHTHLREPGGEESETIGSGSHAAARGGFTTIVAMPNTTPPLDSADSIRQVSRRGETCGAVNVLVAGCVTRAREGRDLADMEAMVGAGAVAFTDDGATVADTDLMRRALAKAREIGVPIMDHALDPAIAGDGVMHEGTVSGRLGLSGIPSSAETTIIERDIDLARETGGRVHIQHISALESIEMLRAAARDQFPVTCEITPHHLALCDDDLSVTDTSFKVNPPLRSAGDRAALQTAVAQGLVHAFATDHAPHTAAAKALPYENAAFGLVGLETAVGVTYTTMVEPGKMPVMDWLRMWTTGPAAILGLEEPSLGPGSTANVAVLDLDSGWVVDAAELTSKSSNTPFDGIRITGRARHTFCRGIRTWSDSPEP